MVDPKNIDALNSELEKSLDDIFGESDIQLPEAQDSSLKEHYPLAELKNLILSIDWEITDEVLDNLLQHLKDLQLTYKHDKIVLTLLQILNSLGIYIQTNRAKAHPKTFKILNSVFASLDKIVLTKDMSEPAKKKILRAELNQYKDLKAQIAKSKTAAVKPKAQTKPATPEAPITAIDTLSEPIVDAAKEEQPVLHQNSERDVTAATLAEAVEEIKRYIHTEIKALKEEIQSLAEQN